MQLNMNPALRNARTGAPTSLGEILEKLDTNRADYSDACTLGDYLSFNLLGLELGEDDHLALLNWLIGWETELTYEGTEGVFKAFKSLVTKIETKYPASPHSNGELRQLNVTYIKGEHSLETDKLSHFEQLEPYFHLACEILSNSN